MLIVYSVIDPHSPVPYYLQLAALLAEEIETGDLAPGDLVPSETVLRQRYGVARGTVRSAMRVLREQGLIITTPRGSFVKP